MVPSSARQGDEKASMWLAGLAFAVAAFALFHGQAAAVALVLMMCGFALVLTRVSQELHEADVRQGLPDDVLRARDLLGRGAHNHALSLAHRVAERAQSARLQHAGVELVAWCELGLGRSDAARNALSWLAGSSQLDPYCRAAVEDACGQSRWALHILERAARRKALSREATLFRIDLCARLRGVEAACELGLKQLARLRAEDVAKLVSYARGSGAAGDAVVLLERAVALRSEENR
ncbi:MAG TPA: hypothetical protein VHB79_32755 [Polyangiaceae bacterium]|nr:hypothetical protein [Polyangiaceae bacterium]